MTEDEAKTKWCPMIRHAISENDNNAANRCGGEITVGNYTCIASNCMMFRNLPGMDAFDGEGDGIQWIKEHRRIFGSSLKEAVEAKKSGKPVPGLGYCGLANKP